MTNPLDEIIEVLEPWVRSVVQMARATTGMHGGPPVSADDLVAYVMTATPVERLRALRGASVSGWVDDQGRWRERITPTQATPSRSSRPALLIPLPEEPKP